MSRKAITVKRCIEYIREWMNYNAIKPLEHDSEYLKFSAKNREGAHLLVVVNRESSSEYFDVWERPFDSDQSFEQVDSITLEN